MSETPVEEETSQPAFNGFVAVLRDSLIDLVRLPRLGRRGGALLVGLVVVAWAATSVYRVQPDEQGVVLRFGKWVATTEPGLHFHLPYPIDSVLLPKVTQINQIQLGAAASATPAQASFAQAPAGQAPSGPERQMLTGDENIVEADCTVFWKIRDAGEFLFRVNGPESAVKIAAEGALREVISRTPIQAAMSDKRQQIADETQKLLQSLLDSERAGIQITQVQLLRVEPPLAVIDAFNDVQRARADQERSRNEAQAYANDILPRARGDAERIRQDAEAYKTQVVNLAQGEANAFRAVYDSYQTAKEVTAWRLYLESVDAALKKATKVIVDTSGKGVASVVPYMPITETRAPPPIPPPLAPAPAPAAAPAPKPTPAQGGVP
jgi:membrane protease subunit HflK